MRKKHSDFTIFLIRYFHFGGLFSNSLCVVDLLNEEVWIAPHVHSSSVVSFGKSVSD